MKTAIKNPILNNPWASNMPNNFCGSQVAPKKLSEPAASTVKSNHRRTVSRKSQIAQNYADQIAPLYPFLNKTQVKAALTLANNNIHKSRLLLDLTNKFLKVPPLNLAMNFHQKKPDCCFEQQASSECMDKSGSTDESVTTVTVSSGESKSSTSNVFWFKENANRSIVSNQDDLNTGPLDITHNPKSDLYDFTESEADAIIQSWSSHKRLCAKKKKVGVSIVKCQKGYRAFLL